ncbi:MAG: hypothetical protein GY754_47280 [bacterium]|nr:hypothetical protein [bacterium]
MDNIDKLLSLLSHYITILKKFEYCVEKKLKLQTTNSPYFNFRDALFHLRKVLNEDDNTEQEKQLLHLVDHLQRGFKDMLIYLCWVTGYRLHATIVQDNINNNQKMKLQKFLHKFRNILLNTRKRGSDISRFNADDFEQVIEKIDLLMQYLDSIDKKILFNKINPFTAEKEVIVEKNTII